MADSAIYKIYRPGANTLTDAYLVPTSTYAVVNLKVCNTDTFDAFYRISFAAGSAADAISQYGFYSDAGPSIPAGVTMSVVEGDTLPAGMLIRVWSSSGKVNFHISGIEVT